MIPNLKDPEEKAREERQKIYDAALRSFQESFPIEHGNYRVEVADLDWSDPDEVDLEKEQKAILEGGSLYRRFRGRLVVYDRETGKPVFKTPKRVLGSIPYLTRRNTFIENGHELLVTSQLRQRPGVYLHEREDGNYEAQITVSDPNSGRYHVLRVIYDPDERTYDFYAYGRKIPAFQLAKELGLEDRELKEALGETVWRTNASRSASTRFSTFVQRLLKEMGEKDLDSWSRKIQLPRKYVSYSLGVPEEEVDDHLSARNMKLIMSRLRQMANREWQPPDRFHSGFVYVHGIDRVVGDATRRALNRRIRKVLWTLGQRGSEARISGPLVPRQEISNEISRSGLVNTAEETNPIEIADNMFRVTRMGVGGIGDENAIPAGARAVHPTQAGFIDPIRTPESLRAGVDLRRSLFSDVDDEGNLIGEFIDARTGKRVKVRSDALFDKVVGLPRSKDDPPGLVPAIRGDQVVYVREGEVDYYLDDANDMHSITSALIPFKPNTYSMRLNVAARMFTQALPLVEKEPPLVQSSVRGESAYRLAGIYAGAKVAKKPGVVTKVTDKEIRVRYDDGTEERFELYRNFPYNLMTYIDQEPKVEAGQRIKPGQLLADSNYTRDGELAVGRNARVAFLPWKGATHEDAMVVSESFARRMAADLLMNYSASDDDNIIRDPSKALVVFPRKFDPKFVREYIDPKTGFAKPGTVLRKGDPIIIQLAGMDPKGIALGRKSAIQFLDKSVRWPYDHPGVVTHVNYDPKKGTGVVYVRTQAPIQEGDKIADRYGTKGVVSAVIPDDQMPRDAQGRPFDVLIEPGAVVRRRNWGQYLEALAGKIAEKTGKPYVVRDFESQNVVEDLLNELTRLGLKPEEDLEDPNTGRKIPGVVTGNKYFLRLKQLSEKYRQERSVGEYSAEETPSTVGEEGRAKRIGWQEINGLLGHGAVNVLWDTRVLRGQANPDFWRAFQLGLTPPQTRVPATWNKFIAALNAAGIRPVQINGRNHLLALGNRDVKELVGNRIIRDSQTLDWNTLKPIKGGLFDPDLTGGVSGTKWAGIRLPEPMPSPVMEPAIRSILGLTEKEFNEVLARKRKLPDGSTGPEGMRNYLKKLDFKRMEAELKQQLAREKGTRRDTILRRLATIRKVNRLKLDPSDWFWDTFPVIPPAFRPISVMRGKNIRLIDDPNLLYRDLFEATRAHQAVREAGLDDSEELQTVYQAMKAVIGMSQPVNYRTRQAKAKGLLARLFSRGGYMDRFIYHGTVDLVGRGVIVPDPNLDIDEVGIPEDMAFELYRPFVIRKLVQRGMSYRDAADHVEKKTREATSALLEEMERRPVIMTRSPVLHKFGIMAHKPVLVKGNQIRMPLLPMKGYAGDFDGDQMNVHVPVSEEARREALEIMRPSRNIFDPRQRGKLMPLPAKEIAVGIYSISHRGRKPRKRQPRVFETERDVVNALLRGELDPEDPVTVLRR